MKNSTTTKTLLPLLRSPSNNTSLLTTLPSLQHFYLLTTLLPPYNTPPSLQHFPPYNTSLLTTLLPPYNTSLLTTRMTWFTPEHCWLPIDGASFQWWILVFIMSAKYIEINCLGPNIDGLHCWQVLISSGINSRTWNKTTILDKFEWSPEHEPSCSCPDFSLDLPVTDEVSLHNVKSGNTN